MDTIINMSDATDGSNQPEMTKADAERAAMKAARAAGREVAAGRMSYTKFVGILLPMAHVQKQLITADKAKDLWAGWRETEENTLSDAYKSAPAEEGKSNGAAANASKLKQVLLLANSVDYAEELMQDTMDAIARLKLDKDLTLKSPYPAFVDVCRQQLKDVANRLTTAAIEAIVIVPKKNPDELKKLKQALKLLEAAEKLRDPTGTTANPDIVQAQARVGERIATIERENEQALVRQAAAKVGLAIV
jgi:hypothetical protein